MKIEMNNKGLTDKLIDLSAFIEKQADLDYGLHEIASMAAKILNMENCSIMLLNEEEKTHEFTLRVFAHSGSLPQSAYLETKKVNEGISGYVAAHGEALFVEDIDRSQFSSLKREGYKSKGFIAAPILMNEKVIGVINVNTPRNRRNIRKEDLELLNLIALLISKSVQLTKLQSLLNSRYVQFALAQHKDLHSGNIALSMSQHPDKMAKVLARTFYSEMSRAGFGTDHMISTATEILSLLIGKLKRHNLRHSRSANRKTGDGQ